MKLIAKIIATSFGFGYAPVAPGTFGTLFGVIIIYILSLPYFSLQPDQINIALFILIGIGFIAGYWSTNILEEEWGKDPGKIVMDESVGLWIALLFIPISITNLIFAFILFRFFDILKPLGIKKVEKLKGGLGVMTDDVIAGVYANIFLQFISYFQLLPK